MKNRNDDTIVAISTPHGKGGVALLRLSGPQAVDLALDNLDVSSLEPRRATYCHFGTLDDVVATYFPRGYTGEPTVEISCHGSLYVQQALLQALVDGGARLAEAGEFTLRAFLHRRLDLSQAEAVADLIDAATPAQHRLAVSQLRGGYAQKLKELRQQLVDLTALLELELDFSQEDVEFADRTQLHALLDSLTGETDRLLASFEAGNALKQGIPVAIVGAPNVGKSTLLNALLHDSRAIVSDVPGTTRDTIEEPFSLGGITFRLIDTAGLRHTSDTVEALGIERSKEALRRARIVLQVVDASQPSVAVEPLDLDEEQRRIVVLNKTDLPAATQTLSPAAPEETPVVPLSALNGDGIDRLEAAMVAAAQRYDRNEVLLTNQRHREALLRMREALASAADGLRTLLPADLVAVDLRDALYHLGSVTGDVANDELLASIFSRFCIGK